MASTTNSHSNFFFPFAPVPSTSLASPASATPSGPPQFTGTFAGKKLSCLSCRKSKAKCNWVDDTTCELCLKRGLICPGSAAPQRKSRQQSEQPVSGAPRASSDTVDWAAIEAFLALTPPAGSISAGSIHSLNSTNRFNSTPSPVSSSSLISQSALQHRIALSPYQTSSGSARVLGPSSSEASLNSSARARLLRVELLDLYNTKRILQLQALSGWAPDAFSVGVMGAEADRTSRVFRSIALAIGARSSSNAEIVRVEGPQLDVVDHGSEGESTPGGYSEWGLRRREAALSIGTQALRDATWLAKEAPPSLELLKVLLVGNLLCTTLFDDRVQSRPFLLLVIDVYRRLLAKSEGVDAEWLRFNAGWPLFTFDVLYAFREGGALAFSPEEAREIFAPFAMHASTPLFGLPDWASLGEDELVVVQEELTFGCMYHTQVTISYAITQILNFNLSHIETNAQLAPVQASVQALLEQVELWYATLERVEPGRVICLHRWTGHWRPKNAHDHVRVICNEIAMKLELLHIHLWARHKSPATTALARKAFKSFARGMTRLHGSERKHATVANLHMELMSAKGWIDLVLERTGEESEDVSALEVGWLVKALRVASFSQAALAAPLRELEAGWEQLRREEVARELNRSPFILDALLMDE